MEASLTIEDFKTLVNDTFVFPIENQEKLALTLIEVNSLTKHMEGGREPFSLIFKGPENPQIPQGTYVLRHDRFEDLRLFLVPVSNKDSGIVYESLFN